MSGYPNKKYPAYHFVIEDLYSIYIKAFDKWCEENCNDVYEMKILDYTEDEMGVDITIYFIAEEDAIAFKLRWL